MISKELLSEVLKQETRFIRYVANNTYEVHFEKPIRLKYIIINIYELAYKCKEWAFNKGYELRTSTRGIIDVYDHIYINKEDGLTGEFIDCRQESDTEPEAIFKACQWILDNKQKRGKYENIKKAIS